MPLPVIRLLRVARCNKTVVGVIDELRLALVRNIALDEPVSAVVDVAVVQRGSKRCAARPGLRRDDRHQKPRVIIDITRAQVAGEGFHYPALAVRVCGCRTSVRVGDDSLAERPRSIHAAAGHHARRSRDIPAIDRVARSVHTVVVLHGMCKVATSARQVFLQDPPHR